MEYRGKGDGEDQLRNHCNSQGKRWWELKPEWRQWPDRSEAPRLSFYTIHLLPIGVFIHKEFLAKFAKERNGQPPAKRFWESLPTKTFPSFCLGIQQRRLTQIQALLGHSSGHCRQKLKKPPDSHCTSLLSCSFSSTMELFFCPPSFNS